MKKILLTLCLVLLAFGLQAQGPTARTVTQTGAITSPVTINSEIGVITTVTATTAGSGVSTFTVNNSAVTATSTVSADIQGYSGVLGTNGYPAVIVTGVTAGSFVVNLVNPHANALNGTVSIGFLVK